MSRYVLTSTPSVVLLCLLPCRSEYFIGNFFYHSDQQEIDIEYVTNTSSLSNPAAQGLNQPPWLQYTNQAVVEGGQSTHATGPAPANVATLHEYRVDWTADKTMFFLDGVLQKTFRTNIPTTAGLWIWNNWANGNPGWSDGPPKHDNVFKIKSITMYYDVPDESC
jgi:beta-glucanase (GH16 family)